MSIHVKILNTSTAGTKGNQRKVEKRNPKYSSTFFYSTLLSLKNQKANLKRASQRHQKGAQKLESYRASLNSSLIQPCSFKEEGLSVSLPSSDRGSGHHKEQAEKKQQ